MTTEALTLRRDYLGSHRRMIVGRALASTLAGALPVPFIDDWAVRAVLGNAFKKIAAGRQVDLDADAVKNLVHGKASPASWPEMAASAVTYRLATRAWKRLLLAVAAARRARAATRTFLVLTLFDHYCNRLHTGLGLDGPTALALREAIDSALDQTPGSFSFEPFRRGALAAAKAAVKAPLELADIASGGALRRWLEKRRDVHDPSEMSELDQVIDQQLAAHESFLGRAVTAIELQLSAEANPYLDHAIERLDRIWRLRTHKDDKP
ncbi:MAG TPA: hypothetical protein VL463_33630 [Kofleriaceae bacterium]|nr:hypothetical protein [Kofleriaceae bacterium]